MPRPHITLRDLVEDRYRTPSPSAAGDVEVDWGEESAVLKRPSGVADVGGAQASEPDALSGEEVYDEQAASSSGCSVFQTHISQITN